MHLVEVGHRAVALGQIADPADRGDSASIEYTDRTRSASARPAEPRAAGPRDAPGRCGGRCAGRPRPLIPAIIEAWFRATENTCQPGSEFRMVESAAWLDTKPEVNSSAAGLPCRSASSASSASCAGLVPLMLRVPPAPRPSRGRPRKRPRSPPGGRPCRDSRWTTRPAPRCHPAGGTAELLGLLAQRREAAIATLRLDTGQGLAAMGVERVHLSHAPSVWTYSIDDGRRLSCLQFLSRHDHPAPDPLLHLT